MGEVTGHEIAVVLRNARNLVKGYDQGLRLGDEDEWAKSARDWLWLMAEMIQAISERERGPMIPED